MNGVQRTALVVAGWVLGLAFNTAVQPVYSETADAAPKTPLGPPPTIAKKTAGMRTMPGFFTCYWDEKEGKLWLEIARFETDFLLRRFPRGGCRVQ